MTTAIARSSTTAQTAWAVLPATLYADHLGSPRILWDIATSTPKWTISWDEFGIHQGTTAGLELPFGFAGGLYDSATNLTRFGARDYDATIGRWVSKDPILFDGDQANLYAYVGNDPINWVDPTGLLAGVPEWLEDLDNSGWLQAVGDFSAGVASGASLGLSDYVIGATGLDQYGSTCSDAYIAGELASMALAAGKTALAAGAQAGLGLQAGRYAHGGGGVSLLKNGKRIFGADWHGFKLGVKMVNRPHLHIGKTSNQLSKHWPWQLKGGGGLRLPWD